MTSLPSDFIGEVERALSEQDITHLILQSLELEGLPFQTPGQELITQYISRMKWPPPIGKVLLFTGHRIDSPDRPTPRFPSYAAPLAYQAIFEMLQSQGRVMGISGGANGGDILFLEACRGLDFPFQMLLALPEPQFIAASVGDWVYRFNALAKQSPPSIMSTEKQLPSWLAAKPGYTFWARNNLWLLSAALALRPSKFVLAALWDGQTGDCPGGTEAMVKIAQQHGAELIHLDTRKLFVTQSGHGV